MKMGEDRGCRGPTRGSRTISSPMSKCALEGLGPRSVDEQMRWNHGHRSRFAPQQFTGTGLPSATAPSGALETGRGRQGGAA
jgi:hypothetical protein